YYTREHANWQDVCNVKEKTALVHQGRFLLHITYILPVSMFACIVKQKLHEEVLISMGDYHSVHIWQLKPGSTASDLEALATSGYLEMQRWIPGVKRVSLQRARGNEAECYVLNTTFRNHQAYIHWRQVAEEAGDYWERYAAIAMQWESMCFLVGEYAGEIVMDVGFEEDS
ncbi:MAG: hypothetical protein ACJ788_25610, partial [Ktedonobacteraceae bacterium]